MNRLLSSALLLAALPLFAQAPSDLTAGGPDGPPQHNGGGERFHGGMGMHGLHAPVTGAPYTAQITTSSARTLQDGTLAEHSEQSTVSRDTQGRTREEMTVTPQEQGTANSVPHTVIVISDPVARTVTRLNPQRKIAVVHSLPPQEGDHAGMRLHHEAADPAHVGENTSTSLGTETIAGLTATGTRTTHALAIAGAAQPQTVTRVVWFSPDLKIDLSRTETDPIQGTHSMLVKSVTRSEPDAALFQVPPDYTVQQAPSRGTLPHTNLPMGHGPVITSPPAATGPGL